MQALKRSLEIVKSSPTLFILLLGFGLFPIYTSITDLPFWNDIAMRIMLLGMACLLYTSPSPRDLSTSRMPSSA